MKNLENITELGSEELQSINGGFWPIVGAVLTVAYWAWDNHDEISAGMRAGVR